MTNADRGQAEILNLALQRLPERSQFYHLEPIGIGTSHVESLTSYVTRLAEAHTVLTRTFVKYGILPLFNKVYLFSKEKNAVASFWRKETRALNGTGICADSCVQALETLTQQQHLRFLTMLPWAEAFSCRGLLRDVRAWCPACYEEWRTGGIVYDPLLWFLEVIKICPQHQTPFVSRCPHCQESMYVLRPYSRPGHCSFCGHWLGSSVGTAVEPESKVDEQERQWQRWVGNQVGDLLAIAPTTELPQNSGFATNMSRCIEHRAGSNVDALAKRLGVNRRTVADWSTGHQLPQLGTLLLVCNRLGTTPLDFLTREVAPQGTPSMELEPATDWQDDACVVRAKGRYQRFDREHARNALLKTLAQNVIPPPSMARVADRLGYDLSFLINRLPDLCNEISDRYGAYRQQRKEKDDRENIEKIIRAIHRILDRGQFPSIKRTQLELGEDATLFLVPRYRRARHDELEKLGLESTQVQGESNQHC